MDRYFDIFQTKQDIIENFQISEDALDGCNILFAAYRYEDYSGSALVIYSKDGKLYEVNGSHCSCYGLEDQWQPEETSIEALKMRDYSEYSTDLQKGLERFLVDMIAEEAIFNS